MGPGVCSLGGTFFDWGAPLQPNNQPHRATKRWRTSQLCGVHEPLGELLVPGSRISALVRFFWGEHVSFTDWPVVPAIITLVGTPGNAAAPTWLQVQTNQAWANLRCCGTVKRLSRAI
jgi:hypothetical protein